MSLERPRGISATRMLFVPVHNLWNRFKPEGTRLRSSVHLLPVADCHRLTVFDAIKVIPRRNKGGLPILTIVQVQGPAVDVTSVVRCSVY